MSEKVRCIRFNSSQDCFAVGTDGGLRIFSCSPLSEICYLNSSKVGSVQLCSFWHHSNIFAIVSGGHYPKFAENTVIFWDDAKKKAVAEIVVGSPVLNVFITHSHIVIVEKRLVHIFTYPKDVEQLQCYDTIYNPDGVSDASAGGITEYLVFPVENKGRVQLVDMNKVGKKSSPSTATIQAHTSDIARLALNNQGKILATGSIKGTLIRLFDVPSLKPLFVFRRGLDTAVLHCLRFSPCSSFLGVYSDKGTVHIFTLEKPEDTKLFNKKTLFSYVGLAQEDGERNCAQFSLPGNTGFAEIGFQYLSSSKPQKSGCSHNSVKCCFFLTCNIVAVCADGTFHRYFLNLDGTCVREGFEMFLDLGDEQHFWNDDI
uniref:WD repeat domain phosphoinositide-interacting protein 4 n=1 Tax=Syphacia muris TaxID=451379 RepID=A0A0N5ARJ1_9BILA